MELEDICKILELTKPVKASSKNPLKIGEKYFIRTVTHYYTGRLKEIVGQWLVMEESTWIADTGRFHDFLKEGKCNEYESFIEEVQIPIGSIVDVTKWTHSLFKGQK